MPNPRMPSGFGPGGQALWKGITGSHELDAMQVVQLTEACRMKDRCDQLDEVLRGDADTWMELAGDSDHVSCSLRIDAALSKANETANAMKQLLAALRLPDESTGKRPQQRPPRGAQRPTVAGGKVSSLERARARQQSAG